jgi:hypothetical protein
MEKKFTMVVPSIKDLGCMNGWHLKDKPKEYVECCALGHKHTQKKLGNCWYEYYCEICKIRYNVDSSD